MAATLPPPDEARREAARLAAAGPPVEDVGPDPYGTGSNRLSHPACRWHWEPSDEPDSYRLTALGALPYVVLAILIGGTIWRYKYDRFGWTTRSSQLYESRILRIASPVFHFGLLVVVIGHVVGLLIPETWTDAVGITNMMDESRGATPGQGSFRASFKLAAMKR